ncbi:MAG: fused response regulator/phosphatase [Spirochaetes bacterium]|nr:MAG: fused response regulator/phosphatase [Spirochaetota bacterium]
MTGMETQGIPLRVLALEDDRLVRRILEDTLREECEFLAVATYAAFQDVLVRFNPDIVLLDVLLPDGDGFEICRALRMNHQYEKLFILMLTAADEKDSIERGYASGANDYIRKPFIPYEVKSKILSYKKIIDFQSKLFTAFNYQLEFSKKLYFVNRLMQKNIDVSDMPSLLSELKMFNEILDVGYIEVVRRDRNGKPVSMYDHSFLKDDAPLRFERIVRNYGGFEDMETGPASFRIQRKSGTDTTHCIISPITFGSTVAGYLMLQRGREFDSDEKNLVSLCTDFASMMFRRISIQHELDTQYERYKAEIAKVRKIQAAALPDFSALFGYDIGYTFMPADDISGDFFDGFYLDDSTYQIVLCDVSGHGMASSYVGNEIRSLFRSISRPDLSPGATLTEVNRLLFQDISEINYFGTAILCRINLHLGELVIASAGHPPVIWYRERDESNRMLDSTGPLLGFFDNATFGEDVLALSPGDAVLFYTDGVTETFSPETGEFYGELRLLKHFMEIAPLDSREIIQEIIGSVYEFNEYTNQADDITMICIKRRENPFA